MEIRCLDGVYRVRGRSRLRCPDLTVASLKVEAVRLVWEGRPVERIYALGALTEGQRFSLFAPECPCGENHRKGISNMLRCLRLDPQVLLRADHADMSLRALIKLSAVCGEAGEATPLERQLDALRAIMFGGSVADDESQDAAEPAAQAA